jgi:hypothetical protein
LSGCHALARYACSGAADGRRWRGSGLYPEYKGDPYKDPDNDGMPDAWESKYGLDPNDPSDAAGDLNGDGYTNIGDYTNGLDPKAPKVDWGDLKNNVDARNKTIGSSSK